MSNIFWKHIHFCFSSLKCLPSITPSPPSPSKHDQNNPSPTITTTSSSSSSSSSLLLKNFNSFYDLSSHFSNSKSITPSTDDYFSSSDTDSDAASPPDFTTIFASQRFFFSSPGRSNSIIESSSDSTKFVTHHHQETAAPPLNGGGVAVNKYSPDPYQDFRCSMQEMIESRNLTDVMGSWDFLHELLLCYLTLNPKTTPTSLSLRPFLILSFPFCRRKIPKVTGNFMAIGGDIGAGNLLDKTSYLIHKTPTINKFVRNSCLFSA